MARAAGYWMEFQGISSATLGVKVVSAATHIEGAQRGDSLEAVGRDGDLWQGEDARSTTELVIRLRVPRSKLDSAMAWLSGSGALRFSYDPYKAYDARIVDEIEFQALIPGSDPIYECEVRFICQPYRRMYPEASAITITESGTALVTQGNAPALPRVKITGSGDFSVTIGMKTMFFTEITDGVIVDCELMDAFTLDGASLLTDHVSEEYFVIEPQQTIVSWLVESGGLVTSVEIAPRWRWL